MTQDDISRYREAFERLNCCMIVPTYNNDATLGRILNELLQFTPRVIVVDDGSTDRTHDILSAYAGLDIIRHQRNIGKGRALRSAFARAIERGYAYAITIDSDGQHMTSDLPVFLDALENERDAIIIGARNMDQNSVPGRSNFGRKFSNFWFRVETGIQVPDTQSGFRLYPLQVLKNLHLYSNKYELEIEVLVRAAWRGCKVRSVPVHVYYAPKDVRVSHFRPFTDFSRVSAMNTVLFVLAMLFLRPSLFFKRLTGRDARRFIRDHLLHSNDSSAKLAYSVAVGALTSILPIWGYQLALAIALAYLFRLNKIVAIAASNLSIPPMIPLVIYGSLLTGSTVLGAGTDSIVYTSALRFPMSSDTLVTYVVGSIVLSVLVAIFAGGITYLLLRMFRTEHPKNVPGDGSACSPSDM